MAAMTESEGRPKGAEDREKANRMAEIEKDRREAGFAEVTVWVPEEVARLIRDLAWDLVDNAKRAFPHQAADGNARRKRKRQ